MLNDELRRAIDAIKLRAPIEDVVRERVPALKKAGALWVACCPFHEERTPSFKVDPRRGTWRCYGACGTGGDQIHFLERLDNVGFLDALEILAARTGVDLPKRRSAPGEGDESSELVHGALDLATRFYSAQMLTAEGQAARRYLDERGLSRATGDAFGVGYAPASGHAFVQEAREAGISLEIAEKAGLVRTNDQGRPYDFFRGRLMIPIRDVQGRTVGFGARRLTDGERADESGPKYINTAETELFKKGRLIYALDRALPEVRKQGRIVLVEGYTDVMAAHQCGVQTVVAVLGTATTDEHAGWIRRTGARKISLVFDGDEAGRKAAYKALHGLLHLDVEIEVVSLPGGDDPCDLCVREGAQAFLAQLEMAQPWFEFLVDGVRGRRGVDLSREVDRVLELLTRLAKPVHRDARVAELSAALDLPLAGLRQQLEELPGLRSGRSARAERPSRAEPVGADASGPSKPAIEVELLRAFEDMLGAVLLDPSTFRLAEPHFVACPDPELQRIFTVISALYQTDDAAIDETSVSSGLADDPARARLGPIVTRVSTPEVEVREVFDGSARRIEMHAFELEERAWSERWKNFDARQSESALDPALRAQEGRDLATRYDAFLKRKAALSSSMPVRPNARRELQNHG